MSKAERTRQFIIEKTAPAFNKYGFEGVSLSMLEEVTGLSKGSIYGNFKDKEEIAKEGFRFSMRRVRALFQVRMNRGKTAKDKLLRLIKAFADFVFEPPIPGGCPLLNHAIEADDTHHSIRKAVADEIEGVVEVIANIIEDGKRNGEFKHDTRSNDLAYLIFTSVEGALMVSRVSRDDKAMKIVVKNCKHILDSISI